MLGDDIVHTLEKSLDTCNQWVTGSSPVRGANKRIPSGIFLFVPRKKSATALFVRTRKGCLIFLKEISTTCTVHVMKETPVRGASRKTTYEIRGFSFVIINV